MKFAIRDDDTSFWTDVEDLKKIYGSYLDEGYKVSFAVVPYSHKLYNGSDRDKFYISEEKKYIYKNEKLVLWLKEYIKKGQVEIMLHGFDHSYYLKKDNLRGMLLTKKIKEKNKGKKIKIIPELEFKDYIQLKEEISKGKRILEETFGIKIKTFVPPSNTLKKEAVKAIIENDLNISGIIGRKINRLLTFKTLINYIIKNSHKIFKGYTYNKVLNYTTHKEIASFTIAKKTNYKKYTENMSKLILSDEPFVLATHYWELLEDKEMYEYFKEVIKANKNSKKVMLKELLD